MLAKIVLIEKDKKTMVRQYELTVVLDSDISGEKLSSISKSLEDLLSKLKGKILEKEDWGEKRLAYEINKKTRGTYWHFLLELPAEVVGELEQKIGLMGEIVRMLLVRRDKEE